MRRGGSRVPSLRSGGVEEVSWAASDSAFTAPCEELAAYLAQVTNPTTVSRLLGLSWPAVGRIVERAVARRLDSGRFTKLRRVGVDEFSYRKRHHYLTLVVDHDRRRVFWAAKGRTAETLHAFFDRLGPAGCQRIELVTADLAASYQKAVRARVPQARVVFRRLSRRTAAGGRGGGGSACGATPAGGDGRQGAQGDALCPAEAPGPTEARRGPTLGSATTGEPRSRPCLRVEGVPGDRPAGKARRRMPTRFSTSGWSGRRGPASRPFAKGPSKNNFLELAAVSQ